jgi:hypothetical protein
LDHWADDKAQPRYRLPDRDSRSDRRFSRGLVSDPTIAAQGIQHRTFKLAPRQSPLGELARRKAAGSGSVKPVSVNRRFMSPRQGMKDPAGRFKVKMKKGTGVRTAPIPFLYDPPICAPPDDGK